MKLRLRLLVAFFLLAVVPLAGLTFYSYYTSLQAFREAVAAEGDQMAADMTMRMDSARRDLNRRVQRLGVKPFYAMAGAPEVHPPFSEMHEVYTDLVSTLGDTAGWFESIRIEPMVVGESGVPVSARDDVPPPPFRPGDSFRIVMPGSPPPPPPPAAPQAGTGGPSPVEEVAVDLPAGDRFLMRRWDRFPKSPGRGPHPARVDEEKSARVFQLQWIAHQMEEEGKVREAAEIRRQAEEAGRSARELAQQALRFADANLQGKLPAGSGSERTECLDFSTEIKIGSTWGGKLVAEVNARELLGTVLSRTRTREGEIAFAQDRDARLFTVRPEHEAVLAGLGVGLGSAEIPAKAPGDWLVVQKTDEGTGVTFGIARPIGDGLQQIRQAAVQNLTYGLGMVVLALVGILPLSRRMTRNLTTLTEGVEKISRGDLDARVSVRSRDEFGKLGDAVNRMAKELKEHQAQLVEQERLRKELEMCRRIQKELLPRGPLRLPLAEVQGVSIPAREVGGDFFNYFSLPDDRTALLIGDVSGKGVPAAILMANLQATLRARLPVAGNLVDLASELDREIDASTPAETYLTLFMAVLDREARALIWLNAGHNTQYLIRSDGTLESMPSTGRPLGLLPGGGYEQRSIAVHPGDTLFLYTDGLVEAENPQGEEFGNERLERILVQERAGESSQHVLSRIEQEMREFGRNTDSSDDATMLVLRLTE